MDVAVALSLLVLGALVGAAFVWFQLRTGNAALHQAIELAQKDLQQERQRSTELTAEVRRLAEARARAEETAQRVPELERETRGLREGATQLEVKIAELQKEAEGAAEKSRWVDMAEQKLREAFQALASQSLQNNTGEFLKHAREQIHGLLTQVRGDWGTHKAEIRNLVDPLEKTVKELDQQVRAMEEKREGAYQGLQEQLRELGQTHQRLQSTAVGLVQALKSPTVRGRWGEMQLRRVVEMAGMLDHVDFDEQSVTDAGRPDMTIHLPRSGILPVDSKTPMQAYLDALERENGDEREVKLKEHAQVIRNRIRELSQKRYWQQFERAPEFVVMFVPNDACLSAAFEKDSEILEFSIQQKVLPTTPVTLLALLKTVAYGWQQQRVAENARLIAEQGKILYDRLARFIDHLQRTGNQLDSSVKAYNEAVGSLESRLFPAVRRFRDLSGVAAEITPPAVIERQTRTVGQLEFEEMAEEEDET